MLVNNAILIIKRSTRYLLLEKQTGVMSNFHPHTFHMEIYAMTIGKNMKTFFNKCENEDECNNDCHDFNNDYFQNDLIQTKSIWKILLSALSSISIRHIIAAFVSMLTVSKTTY